mmetsp:Transcript_39678/g.39264  ORF Transcript_39678/g.39264 Transcript_39678/m.39264 type:complete len:156 (-) Transcript_39678:47-514(-)
MIRYPLKQGSTSNAFFHYLNLIVVILDIVLVGYFLVTTAATEAWQMLVPVHLVILMPSLLYHWRPNLKNNFLFSWVAHTISSLLIALFFLNVAVLFYMEDGWGQLGMFIFIILVTFPSALISFSLLMLLNSGTTPPQMPYFISQNVELYQGYTTV